jgi:hypothetical protein
VQRPCRGPGENSNARFAGSANDSGFVAANAPAAVEIFSAEINAAGITLIIATAMAAGRPVRPQGLFVAGHAAAVTADDAS